MCNLQHFVSCLRPSDLRLTDFYTTYDNCIVILEDKCLKITSFEIFPTEYLELELL